MGLLGINEVQNSVVFQRFMIECRKRHIVRHSKMGKSGQNGVMIGEVGYKLKNVVEKVRLRRVKVINRLQIVKSEGLCSILSVLIFA